MTMTAAAPTRTPTGFAIHTAATAPADAGPAVTQATGWFGFLANLPAVLAKSPPALRALLGMAHELGRGTLTPLEQQYVDIAVSVENGCGYCVAAHTTIARTLKGDAAVLGALHANTPLPDARLEALHRFTDAVVLQRGHAGEELDAFLAAGYTRAQAIEVVLHVAFKTLMNYTVHLAAIPLDPAFEAARWTAPRPG